MPVWCSFEKVNLGLLLNVMSMLGGLMRCPLHLAWDMVTRERANGFHSPSRPSGNNTSLIDFEPRVVSTVWSKRSHGSRGFRQLESMGGMEDCKVAKVFFPFRQPPISPNNMCHWRRGRARGRSVCPSSPSSCDVGESWWVSHGKWVYTLAMMMCTILMLLKWIEFNILTSRGCQKGDQNPLEFGSLQWDDKVGGLLGWSICRGFASYKLVAHPSGGHVQQLNCVILFLWYIIFHL